MTRKPGKSAARNWLSSVMLPAQPGMITTVSPRPVSS
jgi:hypothetical protein